MHPKTLEEDEGFRNKGIATLSGKIFKGTMNEAPIKFVVSSIPAKHENIINTTHSKPAFGDSTKKFFTLTNEQNFTPGPGKYEHNFAIAKAQSRKGSGFFASQTKLARLQRVRSHVPGPGSYKYNTTDKKSKRKIHKQTSFSTLNSSRSTLLLSSHLQQSRNLFKNQIQSATNNPSVGTYELTKTNNSKSQSYYSAFKSKLIRFTDDKNEGPPVGYYQIQSKNNALKQAVRKLQSQKQQTDVQRQERIKKAIQKLDSKVQKSKLGPGVYNNTAIQSAKSFKIKDNMYDRFGQLKPIYKISSTLHAANLNPQGQNQPAVQKTDFGNKTYNCVFNSATTRSQFKLSNQMDPGKYNGNKSSAKKSHLINFTQKWV